VITTITMMFLVFVTMSMMLMDQASASNQTSFMSRMVDTARTINIGTIDFDAIVERLISPTGLVTQFALELEVQAIFTAGWIILGLMWQVAVANTSGGIQAAIQGLGFLLSTQGVATTVVRSIYDSIRSIISRLAVTFLLFGAEATIAGISSVSLVDVGDFLFNPALIFLAVGRGILQVGMIIVAALPIYLFAVGVYPTLRPQTKESRVSSPYYDYEEYGDYHYSAGPDPDQGDVASALNVAMSNIVRSIV